MANDSPTRLPQPIILIRGFGGFGVEDEKRVAYQGFNDGTVYPQKRGENYIYEGLVLRFMKSRWQYRDATNVVGYYGAPVQDRETIPEKPGRFCALSTKVAEVAKTANSEPDLRGPAAVSVRTRG